MKAKNQKIYGDEALLRRLKAECDFIGRDAEIQGDRLIVFALPRKKVQRKDNKRGARRTR